MINGHTAMDRYASIAPACVRVLVLPVGKIEQHLFLHTLSQLRKDLAVIKLNILASKLDNNDFFLSPQHVSEGSILYNFTSSETPEHHRALSPFELFRETLLVIGVTQDGAEVELRKANDTLRERYGRVVHRHLLVLDDKDISTTRNVTKVSSDDDLAPAIHHVTIQFLQEFTTYAKAMQASPSIQTPGTASQGILRSMLARGDEERPQSRGTPVEPMSPTDEQSRPASQDLMPPATTFEQMPAANSLGRSDSDVSRRSKSRPRTTSFDRVPVHSLSKDKLRDRGKARVGVVTGTIYLMAGQWTESLKILVDNTTRLRALNDHIWNAKGLELIVVNLLLQLWAGIDVQVPAICYQLSDKVRDRFSKTFAAELAKKISGPQTAAEKLSSSLPDLLKHTLLLLHSIEGNLELPYISLAEATLRYCKILAVLHKSDNLLNAESVRYLILGDGFSSPDWASSTFQSIKPLTRSSISGLLTHALPLGDESIALSDSIGILTGVATIYADLGMPRKKAITLRTLVGSLTNALNQARKLSAAEMGIHPAASLSVENGTEVLTTMMQGSSGLLQLASELASVYGISKDNTGRHHSFGSVALQNDILQDLLRLCEASPDLQGISSMIEALMQVSTAYEAVDMSVTHQPNQLGPAEQSRLLGMLNKANHLSKTLTTEEIHIQYWDPFLVRSIEVQTPPSEQIIAEVPEAQRQIISNPLIYDSNAARPVTKQQRAVIAVGETAYFRITLQNALDVPIEIERIQLTTDGMDLRSLVNDVHIGPSRLETVVIQALPDSIGSTKITGCRVKLAGCIEQDFLLTRKPWSQPDDTIIKAIGQGILKTTRTTLKDTAQPRHDIVMVDVIASQPQLKVRRTGQQDRVMLLAGERRRFSMIVDNISHTLSTVLGVSCTTANLTSKQNTKATIAALSATIFEFEAIGTPDINIARADILYGTSSDSRHAKVCHVEIPHTTQTALQARRLDVVNPSGDQLSVEIDLYNAWYKPIDFTTRLLCDDTWQSTDAATIFPAQTRRIHIDVPRWTTSTQTFEDAVDVKAELLKHFSMDWSIADRSGNVLFGHLTLSPQAVQAITGPVIDIRLHKPEGITRVGDFTIVKAVLRNRSHTQGPMILQLQCTTPHLEILIDRHVSVAGSMHRVIPGLAAQQEMSVEFSLCSLLAGIVVVNAVLRSALPSTVIEVTTIHSLELQVVE